MRKVVESKAISNVVIMGLFIVLLGFIAITGSGASCLTTSLLILCIIALELTTIMEKITKHEREQDDKERMAIKTSIQYFERTKYLKPGVGRSY